MQTETYFISELADKAKTTVRTIRYYTDEGLLPQPLLQGKYATYTLNHLNRLELIQRLKEAYLPLREIRQIMLSITDEEVRQRLLEQGAGAQKPSQASTPAQAAPQGKSESALEYIHQLLDAQTVQRTKGSTPAASAAPPANLREQTPVNLPASQLDAETWQRIRLAPGVELNLNTRADADVLSRVDQLLAFARKLFRNTPTGGSDEK
jgi:DNA-binding transcriptional MerR regulator